MSGTGRSSASLLAEIGQLREALENAQRRIEVLQERLHGQDPGAASRTLEFMDVFPPAPHRTATPPRLPAAPPQAAWPTALADARPLQPMPGLANLSLAGRGLPAVGFSVCGFSRPELERIVRLVADKLGSDRNFVPVFLTDVMAADVFRRHRFVFEYFPQAGSTLQGSLPWEDYARRRLALIKKKYALTQIVTFGKQIFCGP